MDQVRLYKDMAGEFRWKRVDMQNHKQIGAATEGYDNFGDMLANAQRVNGPESESLPYWDQTGLLRKDDD